jgi:O-antigen/teichoic acid export membrane protein
MKKFLFDTLFITFGGMVNRVKGLLFIPVIMMAVGKDGYGAFVQLFVTIKLAKAFTSLDLGQGFQRYASQLEKSDRKGLGLHFYSIILPSVLLGLLGVLVLYLLSPVLSRSFFEGKFLETIQLSAVIMLSETLYSNANKFYLARKQFKLYSVINLLYDLVPYLMFVLGSWLYKDLFMGIVFYAATDLSVALLTVGLAARRVKFARPSAAILRQYFRYSAPLTLSEVEGGLLDKLDRYFIANIMGLEAVGIYNIIHRMCSLLDFVTMPIRKQMMSYLPKAWDRGHQAESVGIIRTSFLFFLLITVGLLSGLTVYFEDILTYLTGDKVEIDYLYLVVALLGLGILASASKRFYYLMVKLRGNTMDQLWYQLAGLIPAVILNFLLIPSLGILGAAISTFVSYLVILIVINTRYSLEIDWKFMAHLGSFAVIALVVWPVRTLIGPVNVWQLLLSLSVSMIAYFGLVALLKRRFLLNAKDAFIEFRKLGRSPQSGSPQPAPVPSASA